MLDRGFTSTANDGNVSLAFSIRQIRLAIGHSQRSFAIAQGVAFETIVH
jgi:hypothetical protein